MAARKPRAAAPRAPKAASPAPEIVTAKVIANSARGEHVLKLGGVDYRLRPSKEALKAIEDQTKSAIPKLAMLGDVADLTISQLGIIAAQLIRAGAATEDELTRNVSAERLEDLIVEESIARVTGRFTFCLSDACTGGRTASGNAKAATA